MIIILFLSLSEIICLKHDVKMKQVYDVSQPSCLLVPKFKAESDCDAKSIYQTGDTCTATCRETVISECSCLIDLGRYK